MAAVVAIAPIRNTIIARSECDSTQKEQPQIRRQRRQFLFLSPAAALFADSRSELLNRYLKKSEENRAKNDKERLEDYYKRNYGDYFRSLEGGLKGKTDLTETEKRILEWLQKNG